VLSGDQARRRGGVPAGNQTEQGECYEPVVAGELGAGRFVAAWEEAGKVHARVLPGGRGCSCRRPRPAQVTLAGARDAVYAAWAEQAGRFRRIVVARWRCGDTLSA
jgi:hypothetical protein